MSKRIVVIIPAHNEAPGIASVINDIPRELVSEIIVVDNCSTDNTGEIARKLGVTVLEESRPGYGSACLKGIAYCRQLPTVPDIVVFLDGDRSDYPEEMRALVKPIIEGNADMVIGSRAIGTRQTGSMTIPQIFGNWLATHLLRLMFNAHFSDLGPFRAIRFDTLLHLDMKDTTYGWTVEMQVKAAKQKIRFTEIPVSYRKRLGKSKISGTVKGTIMAGYKIIYTLFRYI